MGLWRSIFGVPQREVWEQVAQDIGGRLTAGTWGTHDSVEARIGGYDLLLDTYTVSTGKSSQTYTRMRAPFLNAAGLRFAIRRASIFSGLGALFGRQDIDIGDEQFDKDHIIQGNDVARVKELLSDPALRAMITAQPYVGISVVDNEGFFTQKYGPGVDVLTFIEGGIIKDHARLVGLFALFAAILRGVNQKKAHPLDVPPAEVPGVFTALVDDVLSAFGGVAERVGDSLEARIEDPLSLAEGARVVVAVPTLPTLATSVVLEGALPPSSSTFAIKPKGAFGFGGTKLGLAEIDEHVVVDGAQADAAEHAKRLARPLAKLAPYKPSIVVDGERVTLKVDDISAWHAFIVLGNALDMWQELERARAGVAR